MRWTGQSRAAFERQYLTDSFYLCHSFSVIVAQPLSFMGYSVLSNLRGLKMSKDQIQTGQAQECWNVSETRVLKYTLEMYHKGLKEHKLISAPELDILENKANLQAQKWTDKWESIESTKMESSLVRLRDVP